MKKLMSAVLLVFSALALSTAAFADIPNVPRADERSSLWIVLLVAAVVIIAAVILIRALRRRKK